MKPCWVPEFTAQLTRQTQARLNDFISLNETDEDSHGFNNWHMIYSMNSKLQVVHCHACDRSWLILHATPEEHQHHAFENEHCGKHTLKESTQDGGGHLGSDYRP